MSTWAEELLEILEKEEFLIDRITDEAIRKTDALKTGDIKGIDRIVNAEQPLALQFAAAERNRCRLLSANGLEAFTLSELTGKTDTESAEKLKKKLNSITKISKRLKRVNTLNIELTRARIEFYNHIRGSSRTVYENNGRMRKVVENTAIMDRKA